MHCGYEKLRLINKQLYIRKSKPDYTPIYKKNNDDETPMQSLQDYRLYHKNYQEVYRKLERIYINMKFVLKDLYISIF